MVSGRGVTCGHTLAPLALPSWRSFTTLRWAPPAELNNGHVKGRPTRGCHFQTSGYSHCQPGVVSKTPLPVAHTDTKSASTSSISAKRLGTGLPSTPRWAKEKLVEKP